MHATNLAKFVTIYKTMMLLQRKANSGKERTADAFISGLIGGYLVFGERNAINEQVRPLALNKTIYSIVLKY
jgi:peroxisomal membrane protein 4